MFYIAELIAYICILSNYHEE